MIKCENGRTQIQGSTLDIIQDFANVTGAVRATLQEGYSSEATDELIALAGRMAFAESDDDPQAMAATIKRIGDILLE